MNRSLATHAFASLALFTACGANVVFGGDGSGAGGSGASSNGGFTTDGVPAGGTPSTTATFATNDTTTAGGAPPQYVCVIGDTTSPECQMCSDAATQGGRCSAETSACAQGNGCAQYAQCILGCASQPSCCQDCVNQSPDGAKLYSDVVFCVACEACVSECAGVVPGFCG